MIWQRHHLIYAVIAIIVVAAFVMLFAPKGLWGFVSERYNLTLFPVRRKLIVDDAERKTLTDL